MRDMPLNPPVDIEDLCRRVAQHHARTLAKLPEAERRNPDLYERCPLYDAVAEWLARRIPALKLDRAYEYVHRAGNGMGWGRLNRPVAFGKCQVLTDMTELAQLVRDKLGSADLAELSREIREKYPAEAVEILGPVSTCPETTDGDAGEAVQTHAAGERPKLKPSQKRAAAAYEWALANIDGAESMSYTELLAKLQADPRYLGEGLPDNAKTFARYCRAAGVQRNSPRSGRGPTRSVRRASDV